MRSATPIDAGFIRRVYRTSVVVWALVALMSYGPGGWTAVIGLTLGTALALGSLRALEWGIRRLVVPDADPKVGRRVVGLGILKMIAIGVVLAAAIVAGQRLQANMLVLLLSIIGGFVLVHLVMLLKAIGIWLLGQGAAVTPADQKRLR